MATYRLTFLAYDSRRPIPAVRVVLHVESHSARDARRVATIYVSADGKTVNTTGGLPGGQHYPEHLLIRQRKISD